MKITSARTAAGKAHVGLVNLYIIMFKIRKIKPKAHSGKSSKVFTVTDMDKYWRVIYLKYPRVNFSEWFQKMTFILQPNILYSSLQS